MRITEHNSHGDKNWEKKNNCAQCKHRTKFTTDHCAVIGNKPEQRCPWFGEKS